MDIVGQLRHYAKQMTPSGLGGSGCALHPDKAPMLKEAANEIEELRTAIRKYLTPDRTLTLDEKLEGLRRALAR